MFLFPSLLPSFALSSTIWGQCPYPSEPEAARCPTFLKLISGQIVPLLSSLGGSVGILASFGRKNFLKGHGF